jgi:hypothetical protein
LEKVQAIKKNFEKISLHEAGEWSLQDRVEKKYLMHISHLDKLMGQISSDYFILQINNKTLLPYHTVYFDTVDLSMYYAHHNRKLNRYKIRIRNYLETGESFLEVKYRSNKGRSEKTRMTSENITGHPETFPEGFIEQHTPYSDIELKAKVETNFERITLLNKNHRERITIDQNLRFRKDGETKSLPGLVIVEAKTLRHSNSSPLLLFMKETGIYPLRISKYCTGIIMNYPGVKYNRFKNKLIQINNICHGNTELDF